MRMTAENIVDAINRLSKDKFYSYIKETTPTKIMIVDITRPEGPIRIKRFNPEEGQKIVDGSHDEMMLALQKKGIEYVILTNKTDVSILIKNRIYSLKLPNKQVHDTTGIGDIFCSTFACTMIKEKDFLWAFCFAAGSAQAALESNHVGLQKIPKKGAVENNASYFYNLVDFRDL